MTNTLENKAKFFALYLNQHIVKWHKRNSHTPAYLHFSLLDKKNINSEYLELKQLSSISDEDALEVATLLGNCNHISDESKIYQAKDLIATPKFYTAQTNITANQWLKVIDFLRSRGYALPWMGISVDELVQWGWIKLKNDTR